MAKYLWGIDLGGTKIEGIILPSDLTSEPIARIRIPTQAAGGYKVILSRISLLIDRLSTETGLSPHAIGVSHPGRISPADGRLENSNTVCMNGTQLKKDLESLLSIPILMENDANCFALAEATLGAGKDATSVFGVIVGTGVGGGIIIDKKIIKGCQGIAGEWGHNILKEDGEVCYCRKRGCVETVISGPALERYYEGLTSQKLSLEEIVEKSTQNEKAALLTLDRLYRYFGQAISNVINILDPDLIVLGGGVSNIIDLPRSGLEYARKWVFTDSLQTRIVSNTLGDSAGVYGAAMLVK